MGLFGSESKFESSVKFVPYSQQAVYDNISDLRNLEKVRDRVPEDKIRSRYSKALALIPQLVEISDIVHIYDNTIEPFRIFKKRKDVYYHWDNEFWNYEKIQQLTGISDYSN